jgi:ribulose-5-phosphate 4-epimerase/fuculose-1-phosphate aldolase
MNLEEARTEVVRAAHRIGEKRLTHGRTGNVGARAGDLVVVTPTGIALEEAETDALSVLELSSGRHVDGPKPTKEAFLHAAVLRSRPQDHVVVHTHSTHAAAVSCLDGLDPDDALPPLTAYYAMRVGHLPLIPYHAPGDDSLGPLAERLALDRHCLLIANHGPVVAASDAATALDILEELEETARIHLLVRGFATRPLTPDQAAALRS